jgi:hypothetical protein
VPFTDGLGDENSLLIIGGRTASVRRESLPAVQEAIRTATVMERVRQGMNLLVFEQTGAHLAGMPMDDPNCRNAFIQAPDHPILAGLTDADLADWRGQSDLTEPYPAYPRADLSWGEEFVRWGNRGVVCSFAPEKPQRGAFRALVAADFDLCLAPLLEWQLGRGRMLFCQLDVTSRAGTDPVPTLLVRRMISYLRETRIAELANSAILLGGERTRELAERLALRESQDAPTDALATDPPLVVIRPVGKGEVAWVGTSPLDLTDCRRAAKTLRLVNALLQVEGPAPDLTTPEPVIGTPASVYAARQMDFNPYRYRRW